MTTPPIPGKVIYVRSATPRAQKKVTPPSWSNAWNAGLIIAGVSLGMPFAAYLAQLCGWRAGWLFIVAFTTLCCTPLSAIMGLLALITMAKGAAGRGILLLCLTLVPVTAQFAVLLVSKDANANP